MWNALHIFRLLLSGFCITDTKKFLSFAFSEWSLWSLSRNCGLVQKLPTNRNKAQLCSSYSLTTVVIWIFQSIAYYTACKRQVVSRVIFACKNLKTSVICFYSFFLQNHVMMWHKTKPLAPRPTNHILTSTCTIAYCIYCTGSSNTRLRDSLGCVISKGSWLWSVEHQRSKAQNPEHYLNVVICCFGPLSKFHANFIKIGSDFSTLFCWHTNKHQLSHDTPLEVIR